MTLPLRAALVSVLAFSAACQPVARLSPTAPASASMRGALGQPLGTLRVEQTSTGVRIAGELAGLPTGTHGIHIHAIGRCDTPDFTTAGPHQESAGRRHGLENPAGPHAGDLANIVVPSSGRVSVDQGNPRVSLDAGAANSLVDADGSAIVIHAAADDQRTDPAGSSGARIACGVLTNR